MNLLLSRLRDVGTPITYRAGDHLFTQGEHPSCAVIILGGSVRAYTLSRDGAELIGYLYGRGSVLPLAWLTDQASSALFYYQAMSDVRAITLSKELLHQIVYEDPELLKEFLHLVSQSQASLLLRVTGLVQPRALEKICYALYFLMFRYGLKRTDDAYEIDLKLTQKMLAHLIGQTRESTAKNLKVLEEAGVVSYTGSTYTVYKHQLELFLGEETFQELHVE